MRTAADTRSGGRRGRGVAAAAVIGVVVGLATGWIALGLTRPSNDEFQRAALDEIGLPADLEGAPLIGPALDTYSNRIEERIVAESRASAGLALAVGVIIAVVTTVAAAQAGSAHTKPANPYPPDDDTEVAHGRRH